MARKPNRMQKQKEPELLRQSRKKWRSVKSWAEWRDAYAARTGGNEHDDVDPSAKNKTSGTVFENVDKNDL